MKINWLQYIVLGSALFFCLSGGHGQNSTDSLLQIWKDTTVADTTRIHALEEMIYSEYYYTNVDSAILLLRELYQLKERLNNQPGMVDALNDIGYLRFRSGQYPAAIESYRNGLELARAIQDSIGEAQILMRTGFIYHDNEDFITAIQYYQQSLKIFEALDDQLGLASLYNEFGSIYKEKKEFDKSLEFYTKTLDIYKTSNDGQGNAPILLNIGYLHLDQKEYDQALDHFKKGLEIYEEDKDQLGIASGLAGIGDVYREQGDEMTALGYLERSLAIREDIQDIQGISASLLSMSEIYANQGRNFESISSCQRTYELSQYLGDIGNQLKSCECLYEGYKAVGQAEQALVYHELVLLFTDSLKSEETAKKLQQMEFAQQMIADSLLQVERALKIELAHQAVIRRKNRNRNLAIGASLFFLLLSVGLYSRWQYVNKSKAIIQQEKDRSESLLLNILPAEIAEELKEKGKASARDFDMVSVLFTDFKGYTEKSTVLTAQELVDEINQCFMAFDHICEHYDIEKIKTIGDAYMAAGGLPVPADDSVVHTVQAALDMQSFITERNKQLLIRDKIPFEMRLGIHTGPVVAGIVGVKKFQYDIWGDTVNTASRMESHGESGKVNISQHTYELIKDDPSFTFEYRGKIEVKGKEKLDMWFVDRME